jgi:hypothetical protein
MIKYGSIYIRRGRQGVGVFERLIKKISSTEPDFSKVCSNLFSFQLADGQSRALSALVWAPQVEWV